MKGPVEERIPLSSQRTTPGLLGALHCFSFCSGHQQPLKDLTKHILPKPHLLRNIKILIYQWIHPQVHFLHRNTQEKQHLMHGSNFLQVFASLGAPQEIKPDNGSAYAAQTIGHIFNELGCLPYIGIP